MKSILEYLWATKSKKTLNLYLEIKMYSITLDDLQNLKNEKI